MTDYAELRQWLRDYERRHNEKDRHEAADAIEALVKERDDLLEDLTAAYLLGAKDYKVRAERAEAANLALDRRFHHLAGGPEARDCGKSMVEVMADLAAARAALLAVIDEDGCTCARCLSESEHAPAIAAAQAEKEKTND
jgi:hypothetical protein